MELNWPCKKSASAKMLRTKYERRPRM